MNLELTDGELAFVKELVMYHYWCNAKSVVHYTPNLEYCQRHLKENQTIEGLAAKLGITKTDLQQEDPWGDYGEPSKRYLEFLQEGLIPDIRPVKVPAPQEAKA